MISVPGRCGYCYTPANRGDSSGKVDGRSPRVMLLKATQTSNVTSLISVSALIRHCHATPPLTDWLRDESCGLQQAPTSP